MLLYPTTESLCMMTFYASIASPCNVNSELFQLVDTRNDLFVCSIGSWQVRKDE